MADHARVDSPAIVPSVLSAPSCVLWIPLVCQGARGEALSYKLSSHDRQANLCSHQVRWRAVLLTSARVSPTHVSSEQTETLRQGANAMCNYTLSCQHVITMAHRLSINSMKSCTLIQTALHQAESLLPFEESTRLDQRRRISASWFCERPLSDAPAHISDICVLLWQRNIKSW